jgi:hypothetical protein
MAVSFYGNEETTGAIANRKGIVGKPLPIPPGAICETTGSCGYLRQTPNIEDLEKDVVSFRGKNDNKKHSIFGTILSIGALAAIVIGGLEPMMQEYEVLALIKYFRIHNCNDDIVIYTGYNEDEISQEFITEIKNYGNIVIKYGRYVPNSEKRYDDILGITLVSDNQYAKRY